jgi:uncharacterized protein YndB with AHSA1/START domain
MSTSTRAGAFPTSRPHPGARVASPETNRRARPGEKSATGVEGTEIHADSAPDRDPSARAFACFVAADPGTVWRTLTEPELTSRYLYGLQLRSEWTSGAAIEAYYRDQVRMTGHVVCAQSQRRLTYFLRSEDEDPPVYLTWLLRAGAGGTIVALEIDEVVALEHQQCRIDTEDAWLPILAALQRTASRD